MCTEKGQRKEAEAGATRVLQATLTISVARCSAAHRVCTAANTRANTVSHLPTPLTVHSSAKLPRNEADSDSHSPLQGQNRAQTRCSCKHRRTCSSGPPLRERSRHRYRAAAARRKAAPQLQQTLNQSAAGAACGNRAVGRVLRSENSSCWRVVPAQTCSAHTDSSQQQKSARIARDVLEIHLTLAG
jgi:hypothetical protein